MDCKSMSSPNKTRKLFKILMLHGYKQNESMFYERTGSLRKTLKKYAEFHFCEAPHVIPENDGKESNSTDSNERGWYLKSKDWPEVNFDQNFEKTLDYINNQFETKGPFDGVIGFSQGGILTSILCNILLNKKKENMKSIDFKFAVIIASSKSSEDKLKPYFELNEKLNMPSLHVIGKADKLVNYDKSLELANDFLNSDIYEHELGHCIPWYSDAKNAYKTFFNKMSEENELDNSQKL